MAHLLEDIDNRIISLTRKSDDKVFTAEVRQIPNRFVESMEDKTITVAWQDSENNFNIQSCVLTYAGDEDNRWKWQNDVFTCVFVVPDPQQEVATQTPRAVSPIAVKGAATEIISTK
jgi:hypothetical protein